MFAHSRARSVAIVSLSIAIGVAVLARGGVDAITQGAILAASCTALLASASASSAPFRAPVLLVALAVALAATVLQLVPLPPWLLGALSPGARNIAEVALAPLGLFPAARPLTLDVPATAGEVGKGAAFLAAAAAAVFLGTSRRARDSLVAVVSVAGAIAVGVLAGRALLEDAPLVAGGGTFVNPNHLAALLALAAWPALGRALRERGAARARWLGLYAVAGAGTFLTLSRAGISSFFVAAAVFALLHVRRELAARDPAGRTQWARWLQYSAVPVAAALVISVAAYVAVDRIVEEMGSISRIASDPRTEVWPAALDLMALHPIAGIGRGAFAVAFAGHQRASTGPLTYSYAENEWLQLPLDLGVPVGLGVIAALMWAWLSAARRPHLSRVEIGVLAATAAVAAHAVFDFALELPGVALPFAVLLGLLQAGARGSPLRPAMCRAGAVGLAVAGAAGLLFAAAHPPNEADVLNRSAMDGVPALARSLIAVRPADFLPHAVAGARLASQGRCRDAMPWLVRAMWLAPSMPGPHRDAARCLAASGQDAFARREYRLAFTLGDGGALKEAVLRWSGAEALGELVPETAEATGKLADVLDLTGRRAEAAEVLQRGWEELSDPDLLLRLGLVTSNLGDHGRALEIARELRAREPDRARSFVLASHALSSLGDADGALRELEAGLATFPGSPEIVFAMASELMRQKRHANAVQLLASARWRSADDAARARAMRITALRAQGRLAEAVAEARTARELDSRNVSVNLRLADVLAEAGLFDEAIGVLSGVAALPGDEAPDVAARIEKVRAAARRRADRAASVTRVEQ